MRGVCMTFVDCLPVAKGGVAFSTEEAPSKEKQTNRIWCSFAFVDVQYLLALCVDVETRQEAL